MSQGKYGVRERMRYSEEKNNEMRQEKRMKEIGNKKTVTKEEEEQRKMENKFQHAIPEGKGGKKYGKRKKSVKERNGLNSQVV